MAHTWCEIFPFFFFINIVIILLIIPRSCPWLDWSSGMPKLKVYRYKINFDPSPSYKVVIMTVCVHGNCVVRIWQFICNIFQNTNLKLHHGYPTQQNLHTHIIVGSSGIRQYDRWFWLFYYNLSFWACLLVCCLFCFVRVRIIYANIIVNELI